MPEAPAPLEALFAFARSASLSAWPFIGTVDGEAAAAWLDWRVPAGFGPAPGAAAPGQADLLVVVGRISHKLAPVLMRTHAAMAHPSWVVHLPMHPEGHVPGPLGYASVDDLAEVLPIDVIIEGCPPSPAALSAGLAALGRRIRHGARA